MYFWLIFPYSKPFHNKKYFIVYFLACVLNGNIIRNLKSDFLVVVYHENRQSGIFSLILFAVRVNLIMKIFCHTG